MPSKTKTVNYRRMEIRDQSGNLVSTTFENLFRQALAHDSMTYPVVMPFDLEGGSSAHLVLFTPPNRKEPFNREGCACGCISFYDKSKKIPLIDPLVESIYEEEIEPVDSSGTRRNLEEHPIYFSIHDNHVALIAPPYQGMQNFSLFMYWLLQDTTQVIRQCDINLVNVPSNQALQRLEEHNVRGFAFQAAAYESSSVAMTAAEIAMEKQSKGRHAKRKHVRREFRQTNILKGILQAIGANDILNGFRDDEDLGNLCVSVDFSYRSKKNEEGRQAVIDMARHCGGIEGLNTIIHLSKGGKIKNNELTIKDTISIQAPNGNLGRMDALSKLSKWLTEQIESDSIPS